MRNVSKASATKALACLAFLLISACAQNPSTGLQQFTPYEVLSDPWAFDGTRLRITGEFDECNSYQCKTCTDGWREVDGERKTNCLGVSFRHGLSDEEYVRFTTAIVEGTYTANCSGIPDPTKSKTGGLNEVHVCTDRATQLDEAEVTKIVTRRPATEGRLEFYGNEALVRPNVHDEEQIRSAFQKVVSALDRDQEGYERRVYLFPKDDDATEAYGLDAEGALCVCLNDECVETDWPSLEGHTRFGEFDNPYRCWRAEKVVGIWRFPIQ